MAFFPINMLVDGTVCLGTGVEEGRRSGKTGSLHVCTRYGYDAHCRSGGQGERMKLESHEDKVVGVNVNV